MITTNLFLEALNEEGEENELVEEVGTLVFQSAIMYFLAAHTQNDAEVFESYVNSHVESESFIDDLCADFPEFELVLMREMRAFQTELVSA